MKKFMKSALLMGAVMAGTASYAQIQDEENVTVTMELVPILQLNMNTNDQVNFVFDEISEYIGGITQYGATILTASSSVSWDLFASGTSGTHNAAAADRYWDQQVVYGAGTGVGAIDTLPLTALELHQFPSGVDAGTAVVNGDYGAQFTPTATGLNSVYVSSGSPYNAPSATQRYIAGHDGSANFVEGGSYLTQTGSAGTLDLNGNAYYFVIDYRIVPGLPAVFPNASDTAAGDEALATGLYAQPGVYTMNVKYLMIENQ